MKFTMMCLLLAFIVGCGDNNQGKQENKTNEQPVATQTTEIQQEETVDEDVEETEDVEEQAPEKTSVEKLDVEKFSTSSGLNPSIDIAFNDELNTDNLESYVKIEPFVTTRTIKMRDHVILTGQFDVSKKYKVTLLKGLKGQNSELKENTALDVTFKETEPKLIFSNDGVILPKTNGNKVAFRSVNIKEINVKVTRVFPNNITQFLQDFSFKGNGNISSYVLQDNLGKTGEVVLDKKFNLKYQKNVWTQNEIDFKNIVKDKGIYVVELSFTKDDVDYNFDDDVPEWRQNYYFTTNGKIGKALLITDMGIIAQKEKNGKLVATVLDVVSNRPMSGVMVKGITYNNQIVDSSMTDRNGDVTFEKGNDIFYLIAENRKEVSLLKMADSQLSYDGFVVDGDFANNGAKAFMYSSRGIYRPGDPVNIGIIARNSDSSFPENQPIKIDVFTPRGDKYIENKVIKEGKDGFFTFEFKTDQTSETGIWTVVAYTGGDQNKKFTLKIPIETVVPYKIEVNTEFPKEVQLTKTDKIVGEVKSKYLFGSPAKDLDFNSEMTLTPKNIKFKQYENFTFENPTSYTPNFTFGKSGELDDNGESEIVFDNIPNDIPNNITFNGQIVTKVIESGGRPVINISNIDVNGFDSYVGIETPEDNFVKSGDKLNVQIITVSGKDGNYVAGRKIKYRIYKNEYSWWWDYYDYNDFVKSIKNDKNTVLLYEGEFESTERPYLIDYAVEASGEVFVEVEDTETKQSAGTTLYVSTWQDPSTSKIIDKLKIETDKKKYQVGEKAKVTFEGQSGNRALITVTKSGKILERYWKDINELKNSVDIDVKENMFPNAYVTVALFQNYGNSENDRPIRLYGAVPIMVEDGNKKLDITLDTPDELHPNETFKVKVKNREQGKVDYTLSVVDEGLLGITGFKTPNPYSYFYSKEGLEVKAYDNYSEIIGTTFGLVHQILTPGGDEFVRSINMAAKLNSLGFEQAERFKPLSIFKGVLSTDENGEGEVEITLPNYNGAVRVMVTGAKGEKYGMAEKRVEVKAPIIADITMPRSLQVGDKFKVPVKIFALEKDLGDIEIIFKFQGNEEKYIVNLKENETKDFLFDVKAGNIIGKTQAVLTVKSKKYSTERKIDIDVTSSNPYTVINKLEYLKDGQVEFQVPQESVQNSVSGQITISSAPILAIDNRINEMIRYPYGCVEQITSTAFPQLFIDELSTNKKIEKEKIVNNVNATIRKLSSYQVESGGFAYWPGNKNDDYWASMYVGQFMVLAQEKGYYVPSSLYQNWIEYAKSVVRNNNISSELKSYALYVLSTAKEPEVGELNYIYDNNFKDLSDLSKWYIAGAYYNIGEEELAKKIATKLPTDVHERTPKDYYISYGSKLRDEAVVLDIYNKIFGTLEKNLYNNIVENLQSDEWLSTQTIGYSMLALGDINKDAKDRPVKGSIVINGESKSFEMEDGTYQYSLNSGVNSVFVKGNDLFINEYWQGIPIHFERDNEFHNIKLERKFYAENGEEIDVKSLPTGTTFYMVLNVTGTEDRQNSYYLVPNVALTQILPSGWEVENVRALNIEYPDWIEQKTYGNELDYEDIRDDRVNFFFTFENYNKNAQSFVIKINTVTKGEFTLPGAEAQAMYDGAYSAYLTGFKVEVN